MWNNVALCTSFISSRTQRVLSSFFGWIGKHIDNRPWLFILIGIVITLMSSCGFYFFESENRSLYLWIPRGSTEWSRYTYIVDTFGSYPTEMDLLITVNDEKSDSILSPSNMDTSYDIFNMINNITLIYDTTYNFQYNDVCLRPYPSSPFCLSTHNNIFGFFFKSYLYDDELWQNDSNIKQIINNNDNLAIAAFAGGLETDENVNNQYYVISADVLLIIYRIEGSLNETERDISYEYMGAFQDYWALHSNDYNDVTVSYYTERTFDDELGRIVAGDMPIFGLAIITMTVYLMVTLGTLSCIGARAWLACSAVLVLICSLIMGFGISMFLGTQFNAICALVPYILLGVGVDDMIILVDTYQRHKISDNIISEEMRLSKALASSGLSISLTSFCSSMAFFVGTQAAVPAISSFCMFAAWCFLANYILQFLIFVPLMVYDEKRVLKQNNFCCPCCIHHENVNNNDDKKCTNKFKMEYFTNKCIIPILSKTLFRWIIIILFFIILGGSIFAYFNLSTESDDTKIVPDDSYVLDYIEILKDNFGTSRVHDLNIIILNQDISRKEERDDIYGMINALEQESDAIGHVQQWLTPFTDWMKMNKNVTNVNDLSRTIFYSYLQQFANDTTYTAWDSEIIYNDFHTPTEIKATRFLLTAFRSESDSKNYDEYLRWNEVCEEYVGDNAYVYELEHGFSYLAANIKQLTVENMLFAALGVFGVLLLLLDCRMALFILIIVLMIDIDLFGWMYMLDIALDVVSYTELVIGIGLTVDYVIHITHSITEHMSGLEETNNVIYVEKLKLAMSDMGTSVLKGAFTTFLGVVALAFSKSEAFRIFFNMFLGIIIIAVAHGVLLVPALLGEFKFIYKGMKHENDDDDDNIPYKMEKHKNLSDGNIQLMDYNHE
eukprot:15778_1